MLLLFLIQGIAVGIFTAKRITTVGTTVMRVMGDNNLPHSMKKGLFDAMFSRDVDSSVLDNDIVGNLQSAKRGSIGTLAEKMYKYGGNGYLYGRPGSTLLSSATGEDVVTAYLQDLIGSGTTIDYYRFGPINILHVGWLALVTGHGYDSSTNQLAALTAEKGTPVYLKDMVVVVSDSTLEELSNGSLDQWGTPPNAGVTPKRAAISFQTLPTPFRVDPAVSTDQVLVTYVWETSTSEVVSGRTIVTKTLHEDTLVIPITGYDEADYFQVKYTYAGKAGYWLYRLKDATIPEIDSIFDTSYDALGTFFPITYFRYDNVSMGAAPTSPGYLNSKKMAKYLNIDYAAVLTGIEANPDIGQVQQAMLTLAVPASTTDSSEQHYLFDFFKKLSDEAGGSGIDPLKTFKNIEASKFLDAPLPVISLVIQDARFKMTLGTLGMSHRRKAGVIAPKGGYASGLETQMMASTGQRAVPSGAEGETILESLSWETPVTRHYYQHQITETVYEEVQVFGLSMRYHIFGEYSTVGDGADAILLIPLAEAITKDYTFAERETLYARSLHFVFNSLVVTKVKWYQTGLFKALLIVVMVTIAIYTGQFWAVEKMLIVMEFMTAAAIAYSVGAWILNYVIYSLAIKLFVQKAGTKAAFVVALLAAAAGLYSASEFGSLAGSPFASEMLTLSSNIASGIGKQVQKDLLNLEDDYLTFQSTSKEQLKLLDAANSLLDQDNRMIPLIIIGETPDEFYNRIYYGNIGVTAVDSVSHYVDYMLTLPRISQTLG